MKEKLNNLKKAIKELFQDDDFKIVFWLSIFAIIILVMMVYFSSKQKYYYFRLVPATANTDWRNDPIK